MRGSRLIFVSVVLIVTFLQEIDGLECSKLRERNKHIYAPLRHCQRSNMTIIGWQNFNSVQKCMEFAKSLKGMAINYSPPKRRKRNRFENKTRSWRDEQNNKDVEEEVFFSCQVLQCPEFRNFSTMLNDTRYDYYSLYAFPPRKKEKENISSSPETVFLSILLTTLFPLSPSQHDVCPVCRRLPVRRGKGELHESSERVSQQWGFPGAHPHGTED